MAHILQTTHSLVIWHCYFAKDAKKFMKTLDVRAQPLFCLLNLLFRDFPVSIITAVFLHSLTIPTRTNILALLQKKKNVKFWGI